MKRLITWIATLFGLTLTAPSHPVHLALAEKARIDGDDELALNPDGSIHVSGKHQMEFIRNVVRCVWHLRQLHPAMEYEEFVELVTNYWYGREDR